MQRSVLSITVLSDIFRAAGSTWRADCPDGAGKNVQEPFANEVSMDNKGYFAGGFRIGQVPEVGLLAFLQQGDVELRNYCIATVFINDLYEGFDASGFIDGLPVCSVGAEWEYLAVGSLPRHRYVAPCRYFRQLTCLPA